MKRITIDGNPFLVVKSSLYGPGSCEQCAFAVRHVGDSNCPKDDRRVMYCLEYEREIKHVAHIIKDTPEQVANYLARHLAE